VKIGKIRVGVLAAVTGLVLLGAGVSTAQASAPPAHKVTLCHRTGAVAGGNTHGGFSIITVDIASAHYDSNIFVFAFPVRALESVRP